MLLKIWRILEVAFFYIGVGVGVLVITLILLLMSATPAHGDRVQARGADCPEIKDTPYQIQPPHKVAL